MFVNTLAIRSNPAKEKAVPDLFGGSQSYALKAFENQDYPFEELVDRLDVQRIEPQSVIQCDVCAAIWT